MDTMYLALFNFQAKRYNVCMKYCDILLGQNAYDQAAWTLKMMAQTQELHVDDLESDETGLAEMAFDDNSMITDNSRCRPGTSMKMAPTTTSGTATAAATSNSDANSVMNRAMRPSSSASGRPVSGYARPGTSSTHQNDPSQPLAMAMKTPRTAAQQRPVSAASGRHLRLGTASMLADGGGGGGGQFINLSRLNLHTYAYKRPAIARCLFEYIFAHQNDVRRALELALLALEAAKYKDYWWKLQLGKCYFKIGLYREASDQFQSSIKQQATIESFAYLGKVCERLDQPVAAIDAYQKGLDVFPDDPLLLSYVARVYEILNNAGDCLKFYKRVLEQDNTNIEAISSIAANLFYEDQPEVALNFYRRILQSGHESPEILNNIGLCCFYSQQFDLCCTCFNRALLLINDTVDYNSNGGGVSSGSTTATTARHELLFADIYYNLGLVALGSGDCSLAYQNFRIALSHNNSHSEAYNNLAVLEMRSGNTEMAKSFFQSAISISPHMFEAHYNFGLMAERMGDLQTSFRATKNALTYFPEHSDSKDLLKSLMDQLAAI